MPGKQEKWKTVGTARRMELHSKETPGRKDMQNTFTVEKNL